MCKLNIFILNMRKLHIIFVVIENYYYLIKHTVIKKAPDQQEPLK